MSEQANPPEQNQPTTANLQTILTEAKEIVAAFRDGIKALHEALHADNGLSAKYLADRVNAINDKLDRIMTNLAELDVRIGIAEDRLNKASGAFKELRDLMRDQTRKKE